MATSPEQIEEAFQRCGVNLYRKPSPEELSEIARQLDLFLAAHGTRYGTEDPPTPFEWVETIPSLATAFFQSLSIRPLSTDMQIMVWEILLGCEIRSLDCSYDAESGATIRVVLNNLERSRPNDEFTSANLYDFRVFRHLGLDAVNGQPRLNGYYALRG